MRALEKLEVLSDSAKYDVACTSSGSDRQGVANGIGNTSIGGICHSFSADGRCVSLLKVLLSNECVYDCKYCVNRVSNDVPRAQFTPRELADLTIEFYRRNYIEGLFLSSAVFKNADYTMQQMIKTLEILRNEHKFNGYIHAKAIPGANKLLIEQIGLLADRISVNIEMPSEKSLNLLAPQKSKKNILLPMTQIRSGLEQNKLELVKYKKTPKFAPAGQSTQMIIGASPETDYQILMLTEGLYNKFSLKRVFYSAYIPVTNNPLLPSVDTKPPLLREHRLYQADWLLRFYQFNASEILSEENQDFNPYLDPKCNWAIHNMHLFPVDINKCSYEMLLRIPGVGPKSAMKILTARKNTNLDLRDLKRIGVVLKRAQYFIICKGFNSPGYSDRNATVRALLDPKAFNVGNEQLSMFNSPDIIQHVDSKTNLLFASKIAQEEAVSCLAAGM